MLNPDLKQLRTDAPKTQLELRASPGYLLAFTMDRLDPKQGKVCGTTQHF